MLFCIVQLEYLLRNSISSQQLRHCRRYMNTSICNTLGQYYLPSAVDMSSIQHKSKYTGNQVWQIVPKPITNAGRYQHFLGKKAFQYKT